MTDDTGVKGRPHLPLSEATVDLAMHGSFCPKMCNHTCPVLRATGRSDAVPWGFHRTVADLGTGRLSAADAAARLTACSGCGACAGGCTFEDQDVPRQVREGRAAVHDAGASLPAVSTAIAAVGTGRSPFERGDAPMRLAATNAAMRLVAGCRDDAATVQAATRLLGAAGIAVEVVVPDGCCGSLLRDLGATDDADAARDRLAPRLASDVPTVLLDPHCRGEVTAASGGDVTVADLTGVLADLLESGDLVLEGAPEAVRWHEPCLLVDTDAAGRGAAALAAAGALVELPGERHHGCSGGGMGMPLLDPEAADETAARRREDLVGPGPLVTGCAGAARLLDDDSTPAVHLVRLLADLLDDDPEAVA